MPSPDFFLLLETLRYRVLEELQYGKKPVPESAHGGKPSLSACFPKAVHQTIT